MKQAERDIRRKLAVLAHAEGSGNVSRTCRYFGISRETFYVWRRQYAEGGRGALINRKPGIKGRRPNQLPVEVERHILELRKGLALGPLRISWYLSRYHGIRASPGGIYRCLKRNGMNRLDPALRTRQVRSWKRYEQTVPGHQVQIDVKFVDLARPNGRKSRRYQYTAIDDATRVRALKIYARHTQANAIDFLDHVIDRFPFRIRQVRTDNGSEFRARFHWHVEDQGIEHRYIKPRTPRLNGKVERSHRTDKTEFYQLLEYRYDVDLEKKLEEWERFYNLQRPNGAHKGKTPYEVLRDRLR